MPTYSINGKIVWGICAFKNHFCLWFHQGVFLKDAQNLLISTQENKTKAQRQMWFNSITDINETAILDYVKKVIEIHV